MEVRCPSCKSTFPGIDEVMQTCPACMHSFELVIETGPVIPHMMKLQLQGPLGEALGTFDVYQLKQMIYAGSLKGRELLRVPGGEWVPVYDQPELLSVFELVGLDLVAIRLSAQKVRGWQKDQSAKNTAPPRQERELGQVSSGSGKTRQFNAPSDDAGLPKWAPLAALGLVVVGVVFWLL